MSEESGRERAPERAAPDVGAPKPNSAVFGARRARLSAALGGRPAVVAAGLPSPRTYPGNPYRFRAGSHFLYLVGRGIPGAVLVVEDGAATLYAPEPGPEDALWHGPAPTRAALEAELGLAVRPLASLDAALRGRAVGALPPPDALGRAALAERLGRAVNGAAPNPVDAALAEAMIALRVVHDAAAVAELRFAAQVTTRAHRAGMGATRPGLREWAIKAEMEAALAREGLGPAYGSIVTVHGEVLHAESDDGSLVAGDLLLADVGGETRAGWAADVTRTWPVSGRFSTPQREIYAVVLAAQEAAIAAARPGVRFRDLHLLACRELTRGLCALGILRGDVDELVADDAHALFFPHGLGHLLGLDVHDMEDLGDRAGYSPGRTRSSRFGLGYLRLDRDLLPGMAVTIEPGFYQVPAILEDSARLARVGDRLDRAALARFADVRGIRIEDDVLITAEGPPEVLSAAAPKSVAAVEAAVGAAVGR